jgi:phage gpG-like protein
MRLKVKGDGGVAAMRALLTSTPSLMSELSEAMADEAVDLVAQCFDEQRDPYDKAWQPKKFDNGRAILVKTARLRRSFKKAKLGPSRWSVSSSTVYASAHQDPQPRLRWGGKKLPQRAMLPIAGRGLPPSWEKAFAAAVDASLRVHFSIGSFGGGGGMSMLAARFAGIKRGYSVRAIIRRAIRAASE